MDLVKEKAPVALYPVYDDTTKYSFAYVLVGSEETAYRYGMAKSEEPPTSSAYCVSEIGKLNDADDTTYATFKNASIKDEDNNNGNAHDIALIERFKGDSRRSAAVEAAIKRIKEREESGVFRQGFSSDNENRH